MLPGRRQVKSRVSAVAALEALAAVAVMTAIVALLDEAAPIAGLGVLYLLAVLLIAIRRGEIAALATAILSVLALNFFFIDPRYHLTIADSRNVVALAVFLIAAVVVGRLAATARDQAARAESRAGLAAAREREAAMLAEAASSVLEASELDTQLARLAGSVEASSDGAMRIELSSAPTARDGELAIPLPTERRPGWLYGRAEAGWGRETLERVGRPLARLIDVAVERARFGAKAAEAEATRRADVAKTALLHAISHDLRSPLTAITTAASGLRAGALSAEDREALVSVIDSESARLARLVDDLLDLSRIQAGAVNPRPDWCDLGDVVASGAAQARALHGEHPIELALPDDLPLIQADHAQLERVFSNLIENAVKFSPPEAPVRISGGTGAGRIIVRIVDQGGGIPPSKRTSVFEPFFRGRDEGTGAGLGLAICRGFVEANGGEIRLQSDGGRGTSFAVSFPLVRQPAPLR